jgi:hypothetical protein
MNTRPHRTNTTRSTNLPGSSPPSRSTPGAHEWPAATNDLLAESWKLEKEAEGMLKGLAGDS